METPNLNESIFGDFLLLQGNPRSLTEKQFILLEESVRKFGPLCGIVRNVRRDVVTSNAILSGNQRMRLIFNAADQARLVYAVRYDIPTSTGTVAEGYIEFLGERFTYREVDWSDEWVREACVKANLLGGDWDYTLLEDWHDRFTLIEWGFVETEFPPVEPIVYDDDDMADVADDVGSSTSVRYMVVGSYRVPLTDEEFARLTGRIAAWAEKRGTLYGIVNDLLGGRDGNVR